MADNVNTQQSVDVNSPAVTESTSERTHSACRETHAQHGPQGTPNRNSFQKDDMRKGLLKWMTLNSPPEGGCSNSSKASSTSSSQLGSPISHAPTRPGGSPLALFCRCDHLDTSPSPQRIGTSAPRESSFSPESHSPPPAGLACEPLPPFGAMMEVDTSATAPRTPQRSSRQDQMHLSSTPISTDDAVSPTSPPTTSGENPFVTANEDFFVKMRGDGALGVSDPVAAASIARALQWTQQSELANPAAWMANSEPRPKPTQMFTSCSTPLGSPTAVSRSRPRRTRANSPSPPEEAHSPILWSEFNSSRLANLDFFKSKEYPKILSEMLKETQPDNMNVSHLLFLVTNV